MKARSVVISEVQNTAEKVSDSVCITIIFAIGYVYGITWCEALEGMHSFYNSNCPSSSSM